MDHKPHRRLSLTQPIATNGHGQEHQPEGAVATADSASDETTNLTPLQPLLRGAAESQPAFLVVPLAGGVDQLRTDAAAAPDVKRGRAFLAIGITALVAALGVGIGSWWMVQHAAASAPNEPAAPQVVIVPPITVPAQPEAIRASANGSFDLVASQATTQGNGIHKGEGDIGYWTSTEASVAWPVQVSRAGRYAVELTYSCGGNSGGPFQVIAGSQKIAGHSRDTGGWDRDRTFRIGALALQPGRTQLAMRATGAIKEGLMSLKSVKLVPLK